MKDIDEALRQTLADRRLSRGEKRALSGVLADADLGEAEAARLANRAFEIAREAVDRREDRLLLDWLEDVVKVIRCAASGGRAAARSEAYFTPGHNAAAKIAELFDRARRKADACVFTITDDQIARSIVGAHERGVAVRIVTDDEKLFDPGSDVDAFRAAGIEVRTDRSESHMHHKFAIFDDRALLTGSYNWTRSAARFNEENFIVTEDRRLLGAFAGTFEDLWRRFAP